MNKEKIIALMKDGATLDVRTSQFFHHSFRKGFRKLMTSDVSWVAAQRLLGNQVVLVNGIYLFITI